MAEKKSKTSLVTSTVRSIINSFSQSLDSSSTKAKLAELRNSVGRPLDQSLKALQIVFENLPEELAGTSGSLTREELVIFTTIQLYAIYQQSNTELVDIYKDEAKNYNIGYSLSTLRGADASLSTDERFNAMITSQSFEELVIHLRQMIKLLKAKNKDIKINFVKLSSDLYSFLFEDRNKVKLNWSRSYYRTKSKEEKEGEEDEK